MCQCFFLEMLIFLVFFHLVSYLGSFHSIQSFLFERIETSSRIGWFAEEILRHGAKQLWTSNPEASLFQEGERIFSAIYWMFISSIQFSWSVVSDSLWPHGLQHARLPCPSPTPGVYLDSCPLSQWYHPTVLSLSSPSPSTLNLSQRGLFKWVSFSHQVAKVLEFQLQHQSFQCIFRTDFLYDYFDLLAVQGTLKSLLQHHSSKASILWCSAFFTVQLSHPYMTPGKTIALTRWTFVGKVMALLFNMLYHFSVLFSFPVSMIDPLYFISIKIMFYLRTGIILYG